MIAEIRQISSKLSSQLLYVVWMPAAQWFRERWDTCKPENGPSWQVFIGVKQCFDQYWRDWPLSVMLSLLFSLSLLLIFLWIWSLFVAVLLSIFEFPLWQFIPSKICSFNWLYVSSSSCYKGLEASHFFAFTLFMSLVGFKWIPLFLIQIPNEERKVKKKETIIILNVGFCEFSGKLIDWEKYELGVWLGSLSMGL